MDALGEIQWIFELGGDIVVVGSCDANLSVTTGVDLLDIRGRGSVGTTQGEKRG